jgi:uncharacterized damage-inducible protein DinB
MERRDPALAADEMTTLGQFLDYHRDTLLMKIEGLSQEQLGRQIPSSSLTLAGLVKHLALVEDSWFQEDMLGREMPEPWASAPFADDPDWDFHSAPDDTPDELVALYRAACERSREAVREVGDLDALSAVKSRKEGTPFSLRWIVLHMIEETARHNGHADLLRESIDGVTGE